MAWRRKRGRGGGGDCMDDEENSFLFLLCLLQCSFYLVAPRPGPRSTTILGGAGRGGAQNRSSNPASDHRGLEQT